MRVEIIFVFILLVVGTNFWFFSSLPDGKETSFQLDHIFWKGDHVRGWMSSVLLPLSSFSTAEVEPQQVHSPIPRIQQVEEKKKVPVIQTPNIPKSGLTQFDNKLADLQLVVSDAWSLEGLFTQTKAFIRKEASIVGEILDQKFINKAGSPSLGNMFEECFVNTLETTTTVHSTSSIALKNQLMLQELTDEFIEATPYRTHVITGDIEAMWLRDSMGQFGPYLNGAHSLVKEPHVTELLAKAAFLTQSRDTKFLHVTGDKKASVKQLYRGWLRYSEEASEKQQDAIQGMRIVTEGLIRRQAELIALIDPLANAFRLTIWSRALKDFELNQGKGGIIAERKYELDSLCSFLQLSTSFFDQIHSDSEFKCSIQDNLFVDEIFLQSLKTVLHVIKTLQRPNQPISFHFQGQLNDDKLDLSKHIRHSIQIVDEYSNPELPKPRWQNIPFTGLSASGFRPSDDVCTHPFHIPSNMYAVATLTSVYNMLNRMLAHERCFEDFRMYREVIIALMEQCDTLRREIDEGIHKYAIKTVNNKQVYCYEVSGNGDCLLMDDANNPSLLGIPHYNYMGVGRDKEMMDQLYENTREFVLSSNNPYFVLFEKDKDKESHCKGAVGSPHTKSGSVWPMSMIIQATTRLQRLTTIVKKYQTEIEESFADRFLPGSANWVQEVKEGMDEISVLLRTLQDTTAGTGLMHESFQGSPFNPNSFTRSWFSWANSLFSETVLSSFPLLLPELFLF